MGAQAIRQIAADGRLALGVRWLRRPPGRGPGGRVGVDAAGVAASSTGIGDAAFAGACMGWSVAMPLKAIARIPHHTQGGPTPPVGR